MNIFSRGEGKMEMERKGFFSQLVESITKMETYYYFLKRTSGKAILYLFLLSLIFGTASSLRTVYDFSSGVTKFVSYLNSEVPDFTFDNGELHMNGPMPVVLGETDSNIFIIDTSGKTNESVLNSYSDGILITKHELIQKENYGVKKQSFAMMQGVRFTKNSIIAFLPFFKFVNIFIIVFGIIFHFLGKLISALWLAIAGTIISGIVKYKLSFETQYKLGVYTLTLPIILKAILKILRVNVPYFWVIYYGIAVVYLWKAITMLKKDTDREEVTGSF